MKILINLRVLPFQILLSVFSAFGGLAALLLLLVPIGRMTVHYPERIVMDLGCQGDNAGSLLYTMSQTHPCETKLRPEIAMRVESCGWVKSCARTRYFLLFGNKFLHATNSRITLADGDNLPFLLYYIVSYIVVQIVCRFVCRVEASNETDRDAILKSKFYTVRHSDSRIGVNISYKYTVAHSDLSTVRCT